jgi:DnaJ-domain-containing protein 1
MTTTEVIIVIGGLVGGYWIVSVFLPLLVGLAGAGANSADANAAGRGKDEAPDPFQGHREWRGRNDPSAAATTLRWFEVLGVREGATRDEISAAYKLMISQYHPDKVTRMGPDIRQLAELRSKEINAAYEFAMKL